MQVPRLYIQWPTVGFKDDDDYALSVMSSILSGSRTARLTKALVYDTQIASQIGAFQNSAEDVGVFQVTVIPRPEHNLTELEAAVDQVIQKFISEGPTAEELQKAKSGLELGFIRGLESNLGKANQLISGAIFYGNPGQFSTDYQKTLAVTAADVKRVANQYLTRSRIVLSVVPKGKKDQASKAARERSRQRGCRKRTRRSIMRTQRKALAFAAALVISLANIAAIAQQTLDRTVVPSPGPTPVLRVPTWTKQQLANGATLIVSERHSLPLVSFTITFLGGSNQFEPAAKRGVASMTASMLSEGTTTKTGDQLSDALQLLGTGISSGVGGEEGSMGFVSTAKNFDATLAILADDDAQLNVSC